MEENPRDVTLYTLSHPDNGTVVYAGQTRDPERRSKDHANPDNPSTPKKRKEWTARLKGEGKSPVFKVERTVTMADADEGEREMIAKFTANGEAEFNVQGASTKTVALKVYVSSDALQRLQLYAILHGKQQSEVAQELFDKYLPRYEVKEIT